MSDPYFANDGGTDEGKVRVAAAKQLETAVNYTPVQWSDQMTTALQQQLAIRASELHQNIRRVGVGKRRIHRDAVFQFERA